MSTIRDSNETIKQWEDDAKSLAVNSPSMIDEAITLHRLLMDDLYKVFDADWNPMADEATCRAAEEKEIKAFRILARMPCMTSDEAQTKLAYFLEPVHASQMSKMYSLTWEAYVDEADKGRGDSPQERLFLRTLYVNGGLEE